MHNIKDTEACFWLHNYRN